MPDPEPESAAAIQRPRAKRGRPPEGRDAPAG
jgi:hypothetical protein